MSLRDSPRHVVMVQNYQETVGKVGQTLHTVPDGDPIRVRCNSYPLSADEVTALGLVNEETRQLYIHRGGWPGNQYSTITHKGSTWEQAGPAVDYDMGEQTAHIVVVIKRTGTA